MTLSDKIRGAPESAGVYLFKDRGGRIIYIGKAASLRNRLSSYTGRVDEKCARATDRHHWLATRCDHRTAAGLGLNDGPAESLFERGK